MISLGLKNSNYLNEEIVRIIQGWTVEVKLYNNAKAFDGMEIFQGMYVSHDADYLTFEVFEKDGKPTFGAKSIGFGWDLIEHIELIGMGKVVATLTVADLPKIAKPSRTKK